MSFYVYIHTCPNNKRYIGVTKNPKPEYRWSNGEGYKSNKHFYRAIQKYGWKSIKHDVFEVTTESEMYYLEKYLIAYYQSNKSEFGYNNSSGGESSSYGCRRSNETKIKISNAKKGIHFSEETKIKISEAKKGRISNRKGKHHSEEAKKKISEALKRKHWKIENGKRIWY